MNKWIEPSVSTVEELQDFKNYCVLVKGDCECDCGDIHEKEYMYIIFGTLKDAEKLAKEKDGKIVEES